MPDYLGLSFPIYGKEEIVLPYRASGLLRPQLVMLTSQN